MYKEYTAKINLNYFFFVVIIPNTLSADKKI